MGIKNGFKFQKFAFAKLLILTLSGFISMMDKAIRAFRSNSLSGAREDEMAAPAVAEREDEMTAAVAAEQRVIAYMRAQEGSVFTSTVVHALEEEIPETEIMKALRWLLQNGDLQMGATMNLELSE